MRCGNFRVTSHAGRTAAPPSVRLNQINSLLVELYRIWQSPSFKFGWGCLPLPVVGSGSVCNWFCGSSIHSVVYWVSAFLLGAIYVCQGAEEVRNSVRCVSSLLRDGFDFVASHRNQLPDMYQEDIRQRRRVPGSLILERHFITALRSLRRL